MVNKCLRAKLKYEIFFPLHNLTIWNNFLSFNLIDWKKNFARKKKRKEEFWLNWCKSFLILQFVHKKCISEKILRQYKRSGWEHIVLWKSAPSKKKTWLIWRVANKTTDGYFWGLSLFKKLGRQTKFSQPSISTFQIIFNNHSSRRYFWKRHLLSTTKEFNFLDDIFLEQTSFDDNRIQLFPRDISGKSIFGYTEEFNFIVETISRKIRSATSAEKDTLFIFSEDISGCLPRYELFTDLSYLTNPK